MSSKAARQIGELRSSEPSPGGRRRGGPDRSSGRPGARRLLRLLGPGYWFDLGVSMLDAAELGRIREPAGWLSEAAHLVRGRRRIRQTLGLEPDELDRAVPPPGVLPLSSGFPTMDEVLEEAPERLAARRGP